MNPNYIKVFEISTVTYRFGLGFARGERLVAKTLTYPFTLLPYLGGTSITIGRDSIFISFQYLAYVG